MDITLPAALAVIGFVFLVAAGLLLLSWLQHRELTPLGLWGMAFGLGAAGVILVSVRGEVAHVWSILVANVLIALGYGAIWSGARLFAGRRVIVWAALGGAATWPAAAAVPGFYDDAVARAVLAVTVNATYTLAAAAELWRSRDDSLPSRWPAIALLLLHACALPSRVPLVSGYLGLGRKDTDILIFVTFESMLLAMAGAYLFGSLVRERMAKTFQRSAMADSLTGVANRRAFLQQGELAIQRAAVDGRVVCLLLFDIDHFKAINDQHGHAAGDAVLVAFCRVAKAQLRPSDLFARIGGEEFACLLVDVDAKGAVRVAERVLFAFEGCTHDGGGEAFGVTASAGIAEARPRESGDLSALMLSADRALYRAKNGGRNRIEEDISIDARGGTLRA